MKIGGIAIVAVWLAMVAFLAQDSHVTGPVLDAKAIKAGEEWMGIYLNGGKVGYVVDRVEKTPDGYSLSEDMVTTLTVQGSKQEVRTTVKSRVDDALLLKDFEFSLKSGFADMEIMGRVAGKVMKLGLNTAGTERAMELPLSETPHLSTDLDLYLRREGLKVGKKIRLPFFDPSTLSQQYMDLTVEAEESLKLGDRLLPVYRIKEEYAGVSSTVWMNPEIGAVKGEGFMGFTFLRETKEQAMRPPDKGYGGADIIALASIHAKGNIPEPRNTVFMKARLGGADLSGIELSGERQAFSDGVLTVTQETTVGLAKLTIPVKDPAFAEYLKPAPFVESDDPKIKRKAAEVLAGEMDAFTAARKLADWVNKSVKKQTSAGIPSAVEVLSNLSGDCNEHTVLFTALARSVGIPTRMDAGIVMLDGSFYYHAWPEVYVGKWISIDPTFGQFPADATHIKLVEGGLDKQVSIAKVVGKLSVEVLEYR